MNLLERLKFHLDRLRSKRYSATTQLKQVQKPPSCGWFVTCPMPMLLLLLLCASPCDRTRRFLFLIAAWLVLLHVINNIGCGHRNKKGAVYWRYILLLCQVTTKTTKGGLKQVTHQSHVDVYSKQQQKTLLSDLTFSFFFILFTQTPKSQPHDWVLTDEWCQVPFDGERMLLCVWAVFRPLDART